MNLPFKNPPPPATDLLRSTSGRPPELVSGRGIPLPSLVPPNNLPPLLELGRRPSPLLNPCEAGCEANESCGVGGVIIRNDGTAPAACVFTTTFPPLALLTRLRCDLDELAGLELRLVARTGVDELRDELRASDLEDAAGGGERLKSTGELPYRDEESSPLV